MNSPRWRIDAWPPATKARKSAGSSGARSMPKASLIGERCRPLNSSENGKHMVLLVFGNPAPLVQEGPDGRIGEEGEKIAGIAEAAGHPDETDVPAPELRPDGDPDADGDPHDLAGLQEFGGGLRRHIIVVDHRQAADPLDPGVHDQMGRGLAPFRVGVVDMVVEGDLVPLLRHLQEVIAPQFLGG